MIPRATYRLQFHKGFTFADAERLAPYLRRLGISHLYSSPIGTARAGSTHGYDQVDPTRINPELGGEDGFRALAAALKREGLGVILDIVPNHMAVGGADNRWWLDVLEKGEASDYAQMFDIDWRPADPALRGKVLAPFLGASYGEALVSGALKLVHNPEAGTLAVVAHDTHRFPLRREDYDQVLNAPGGVAAFDGARPDGRARLHALLEGQAYRLAHWRTANDEINWRRFFDITELAGVRVERDDVFELIHALPLRLYRDGLIDGVRVDHIDGLADPAAYGAKLRRALEAAKGERPGDASPGPAYFVVEKILAPDERLSPDWLTDGTTGYDYMNLSAALLHAPDGAEALKTGWADISGRPREFEVEERAARLEILAQSFAGQLDAVVLAFHALARSTVNTRDLTAASLRRALTALLSVFPAYRTYGVGDAAPASDAPLRTRAAARARDFMALGDQPALDQIIAWLAGEGPGEATLKRDAVRRFQQLSAPVSAKSVEDTAFYRHAPLLSRNDVGFDAGRVSMPVKDFHQANQERLETFPHALLTTATHDHKRGEDVRARLAVLSEIPDRWIATAKDWIARTAAAAPAIDPSDAYPLFQTLVGAWPMALAPEDAAGLAAFEARVAGWQEKALREAKLHSSWSSPNADYEARAKAYLAAVLDPAGLAAEISAFAGDIAGAGAANGLVQTLLRCTVPGVADTYQGTEFWDLSLVDPDNRRPVDYAARQSSLWASASTAELAAAWREGRVKQRVLASALETRRAWPEVFQSGDYIPLTVVGRRAGHVLAFARRSGATFIVVAAAIRCADAVVGLGAITPKADWWGDTAIQWPSGVTHHRLTDLLRPAPQTLNADSGFQLDDAAVPASKLFALLPVALLGSGKGAGADHGGPSCSAT
jgi:(1->4)-alpha-D-glucan 1-alpha-D-glucosylmutase